MATWFQKIGSKIKSWWKDDGKEAVSNALDFVESVTEDIPYIGNIAGSISNFLDSDASEDKQREEMAWQEKQADDNREFQHNERIETQDYNRALLEDERKYNSDVEVAKRAQQAGRNLNSVFGGSSNNGFSQLPYSTPMSGNMAMFPGSGLATSMLTSSAQVQALLANANKDNAAAERDKYGLAWDKLTEDLRLKTSKAVYSELCTRAGLNIANAENARAEANYFDTMSNRISMLQEHEINEMVQRLENMKAEHYEIISRITLNDKTVEHLESLINVNEKTADKIDSEIDLNEQLIEESEAREELIGEQKEGQDIQNQLQTFMKEFSEATGIPPGADEFTASLVLYLGGLKDEKGEFKDIDGNAFIRYIHMIRQMATFARITKDGTDIVVPGLPGTGNKDSKGGKGGYDKTVPPPNTELKPIEPKRTWRYDKHGIPKDVTPFNKKFTIKQWSDLIRYARFVFKVMSRKP